MADDSPSLDIVIRTRAELEGAQSAEAQLDRDIGKARELGQEYAAQEAQSQRARAARTTGTESGEELEPHHDDAAAGKPGVEIAGPASAAEPERPPQSEPETSLAREAGEQPGLEPPRRVHCGDDTESRGFELPTAREHEPETTDARDNREKSDAHGALPNFETKEGDAPELEFDTAGGRMAELQAQSIQAAGERMRAALEQNGQVTLALLNRTLELIEQQNRKLGELERQIEQLSGRIKSLKNP